MIRKKYSLYCTNCGKEHREIHDSEEDVLKYYPTKDGWVREKVENGSEWDFCPICYKYRKEERS